MPERTLTMGEVALLRPIFGATLPYPTQVLDTNDGNWGGADNSITPFDIPHMSNQLWTTDFSGASVPDESKWTFVHEMTHVWQYYHGVYKLAQFVGLVIVNKDYDDVYYYDLGQSYDLDSYNLEQQASIVADYYFITKGLSPKYNRGSAKERATYYHYIAQVQSSDPIEVYPTRACTPNRPD